MAFESVEYIMRDVPWGWLVRYMHSTGASAFFVVVYLHMCRGLHLRQLPQAARAGVDVRLRDLPVPDGRGLHGLPAALGADELLGRAGDRQPVLPPCPFIGPDLALLIRGDFVVGDATLNRFFSFHVIAVPLVLLGLVVAHVIALHEVGSNNPDGVEIKEKKDAGGNPLDGIPFHPYYTVHDIFGVCVFLFIFSCGAVLRARRRRLLPRVQQLHRGRSAEDAGAHRAGLVLHAVLLDAARDHRPDGRRAGRHRRPLGGARDPARAASAAGARSRSPVIAIATVFLLKTFDAKFWGVVVMGGAVLILFFLPWLDRSPVKSIRYRPDWHRTVYGAFVVFFLAARLPRLQPPSPSATTSRSSARCSTSASSC